MHSNALTKGDILIIDDNAENQYVLCTILNQEGFKARPALTGGVGLTAAREVLPDLILLDLMLPDFSGYEVLTRLKAEEKTAELPVIIISVLDTIADKVKAFKAGCVDYINKPFQPEEALARINTHIELVKNRKRLRESENRYHELFNNIKSGVAVYRAIDAGADFEFVNFNKAGMRIDNIDKAELIGKKVSEIFPGIKEQGFMDVFLRVWKTGNPEYIPAVFYQDSRVSGWRENYVYKLPSGELVTVYEDVTEKIQAEEEILEYSELARSLLNAATDAVLIFNPEGLVLDINRVFADNFMIKRDQIIGKNSWIIMPVDFVDKWKRIVSYVLEIKQSSRLSFQWEKHWYDTVIYPVFDQKNIITKLVVFFHDITESKEHEEWIKRALVEKEILLKEIHHRVKNNLQIISSLLSLQTRYPGAEQLIPLFEDSKNRIYTISLIHQLLYQSGDLTNIDFVRYIKELTAYLYQSMGLEKEKIQIRIEMSDLMLTMNKAMPCGLIINELISNSLKYAFPGNAKGEIIFSFYKDNKNRYLFSVKDNGIGIPSHINIDAPGTMGLKLVQTLVAQLEGTLIFTGDRGTCVDISFPADTAG